MDEPTQKSVFFLPIILTVQPIPDTMEAGRNYFLPD